MRMADRYSDCGVAPGSAPRNAQTAEACVTVTSLSTPREPITTPPRIKPLSLTWPATDWR